MQIYPAESLDKLGFNAVRSALATGCLSEAAAGIAHQLLPALDRDATLLELSRVYEALGLVQRGDPLPLSSLPEVGRLLSKANVLGNYLQEDELMRLLSWLSVLAQAIKALVARKEEYPALGAFGLAAVPAPVLQQAISKVLGPDGQLRDDASETLAQLRRQLRELQQTIRQLLYKGLRLANKEGWSDENELVMRSERLLVPVLAEHKNKFPGIVHDLSGSGQTVYMEPLEALSQTNQLRELQLKERYEIIKILTQLTDRIHEEMHLLEGGYDWLLALDLIQAKAKLAHRMEATLPQLRPGLDGMSLKQARHPQLLLQKGAKAVVPHTFRLDLQQRVLVISGPNAGGKSVALKATGLLVLMLQAGLLVPVHPDSVFGWVEQLFIDIGDDQSVQNDLSTYSSHLSHMRAMLEGMTKRSLFLIDEFGTGTDPQLGGPIAEALLGAFVQSGAYGVVTTHYSSIKDFAGQNAHTLNAAMQFDRKTLLPTYQLEVGLPGSSFAFEMAERAGIPRRIIEQAKNLAGDTRASADELLGNLRAEQSQLRALMGRNKFRDEQLEGLLREQQAKVKQADAERKQILKQAHEEAQQLIKLANARIEQTIRDIKESQADKHSTRDARKTMEVQFSTPEVLVQAPEPEVVAKPLKAIDGPVQVGDLVRVLSSGAEGRVVELKGKDVVLALGDLRAHAKLRDVVKLERALERTSPTSKKTARPSITDREFAREIDVRGLRPEEAEPVVQHALDEAVLGGLDTVYILHGKGTGALRHAVRGFIKRACPQVKHLEDAPENQGGAGVTVCRLSF